MTAHAVSRGERTVSASSRSRRYAYTALVGGLLGLGLTVWPFGQNTYQGTGLFVLTLYLMALQAGLMFVGLYGLHRRYGEAYGRLGLVVAALFGFGLAWMAVAMGITALVATLSGDIASVEAIEGSAWFVSILAMLVASVFGVLLRRNGVLGTAAVVMAATVPLFALLVVVLDALLGDVGAAFGLPLAVVWVVVGHRMLRDADGVPTGGALPQ